MLFFNTLYSLGSCERMSRTLFSPISPLCSGELYLLLNTIKYPKARIINMKKRVDIYKQSDSFE